MNKRYMIVAEETHRADIFKRIYFYRWDWKDAYDETPTTPYTLWFFDEDTNATVYYREEHKDVFHSKYFYVEYDDEDVMSDLQNVARILTLDDLIKDFHQHSDDLKRGSAVYQIGIAVTQDEFTPSIRDVFVAGLQDRAPGVRIATLWGMAWPHWVELKPLIQDMHQDEDEAVRKTAKTLLEAFEKSR